MAVVDSAEKEVVPELGVPGPMSDGVTGSEGGGGRLISVGVVMMSSMRESEDVKRGVEGQSGNRSGK
jgi:hypothetical protein